MSYITIDSRLRVGEKAILDGDREHPVTVKWIGNIFALVENPTTHTEWSVMANRLEAVTLEGKQVSVVNQGSTFRGATGKIKGSERPNGMFRVVFDEPFHGITDSLFYWHELGE